MAGFVLPSKADVGYLDPEIAGEGERVIHSDGEVVNWTAPAPKPIMPDFSQIKSIARYFNRQGYAPWPAWLYHPSEEPRLVKNAAEGAELGVCYREATADEIARYGQKAVWDWQDDSKWRPHPWAGTQKFDPSRPGTGKTVIFGKPDPSHAQNDLVRAIIPEVAAAVAKALQMNGPAAPASVDPKEWAKFQEFLAWQKSAETVEQIEDEVERQNALASGLTPEQELSMWQEEAKSRGIKIDGRWSLERLKAEVEKAA